MHSGLNVGDLHVLPVLARFGGRALGLTGNFVVVGILQSTTKNKTKIPQRSNIRTSRQA